MTSIALTIAGSDSGGGAGIQADLKTFSAFQVFGTSVLTCITAQNPQKVIAIQPVNIAVVQKQLEAIFSYFPVNALKTGMLYSQEIIQCLSDYLEHHHCPTMVVDPVMVATSGARLLQPEAIETLKQQILPKATLVTPNVKESEILTNMEILTLVDMQKAAERIHTDYQTAVIVKGGHLPHQGQAVDYFFDGKQHFEVTAPFLSNIETHGTGCTFSAAITASLALGKSLPESVKQAKKYLTHLLQHFHIESIN